MTTRWRSDPAEAAIDINHDGNMFSFFYQSRLRFQRSNGGAVFDCEGLRGGCDGLSSHDGASRDFSYVNIRTAPHAGWTAADAPPGAAVYPCAGQIPANQPSPAHSGL